VIGCEAYFRQVLLAPPFKDQGFPMSIIHQALKKAAAEGQISPVQSNVIRTHPSRHFSLRSNFLIFLLGLVFLSFFIFSARSLWPIFQFSFLNERNGIEQADEAKQSATLAEPTPAPPLSIGSTQEPPVLTRDSGPQGGETALAEGLDFYNQGKMDLANESFKRAVALLPLSPIAHNNFGLTLRNRGEINEAIQHYEEAIRLNANYAEAHNNLGMAHDRLGSIDQASFYYQKAIRLKPAVPEFHLNYATWLERKGDFIKARQEYQVYLNLESKILSDGKATNRKKESIALVKARLAELKGF
jgi:tetratricopeptide (TPR) repeat protein